MQHLQPNTLLHGGTYKIVKLLGQGSFGITYLAEHTSLGKKVAIKEFFMKELNSRSDDGSITGLSDGSLSYNYAQKFRKEAQNLARMEHPNIVRVTDSFDENGTFYYVMEYIDGQNLNEYVKNQAVSESEAISIIKDVANALIYMHEEKHMLHLDLKPGNIMRRASDGHIFLIDFGLSKHYSNDGQPETSTTIGLGTAGYAPIEQANQAKNGEFRPTIDVYALGATLFKLLTRETPPAASELVSDDELLADKLKDKYVPQNLIDFIVKTMLPNVRKRIQTIREFKNTLPASNNTFSSSSASSVDSTEETIFNDSDDEETELVSKPVAPVNHPYFSEASYIIDSKYVNMPTLTRAKAEAGDMDAAIAYGMMALRGQGFQQNTDIAFGWFNFAREKGDDRGAKLVAEWDVLKNKYDKEVSTVEPVSNNYDSYNSYANIATIASIAIFSYNLFCIIAGYIPYIDNIYCYYGYYLLLLVCQFSILWIARYDIKEYTRLYTGMIITSSLVFLAGLFTNFNAEYLFNRGVELTDTAFRNSETLLLLSRYGYVFLIPATVLGLLKKNNNFIFGALILILMNSIVGVVRSMSSEDIYNIPHLYSGTESLIYIIVSLLVRKGIQTK